MAAARFGKRRTSVSVVASRKNQGADHRLPLASVQQRAPGGSEVALRTSIAIATRAPATVLQRHEVEQQLGRQVVDAVVARILQRMQGDRLAGAGHAGDDRTSSRSIGCSGLASSAGRLQEIPAWARVVVGDALAAEHAAHLAHALPRR